MAYQPGDKNCSDIMHVNEYMKFRIQTILFGQENLKSGIKESY